MLSLLYKDFPEGKLNTLRGCKTEWEHIQIDKQSPTTEINKYFPLEMCKEVAEGVRMQCGQEYFPEDEQDPRAALLYIMTQEGRRNIPTEKPCDSALFSKVSLLSIIISITQKQEFQY